jgi:hypothetical protein
MQCALATDQPGKVVPPTDARDNTQVCIAQR